MNLNLEEIEKRLSAKHLTQYLNCNSTYEAKFVKKKTIPEELKEKPLYEITDFSKYGIETAPQLNYRDGYCFGGYLRNFNCTSANRQLVSVYINTVAGGRDKENYNNYLWMTKEQLEEHLNYLRNVLGFDFFFRIIEAGDWYIVQFDFKNMSKLKIKYTLFWTRYTYEFPSSLCMVDAYILKTRHPEEDLHNLLRIPQRFVAYSRFPVRSDQSISVYGKFLTLEELKHRLERTNISVCDLFQTPSQNTWQPRIEGVERLKEIIGTKREYPINTLNHGWVNFSSWLHDNSRLDAYEEMLEWYRENKLILKNSSK